MNTSSSCKLLKSENRIFKIAPAQHQAQQSKSTAYHSTEINQPLVCIRSTSTQVKGCYTEIEDCKFNVQKGS
ncbi:hypothetical protein RRG08_043842 [Elysia crispata]|uniref:Uncharacterized protein n=1 Tax=Elysia crispata TaxID=231223 RepID=A0AAE0YH33_9GAST|nr:hypothetical protein RRG08_043842 [Elysia crispata]